MELMKSNCPVCEKPVWMQGSQNQARCDWCKTSFRVRRGENGPSLEPVDISGEGESAPVLTWIEQQRSGSGLVHPTTLENPAPESVQVAAAASSAHAVPAVMAQTPAADSPQARYLASLQQEPPAPAQTYTYRAASLSRTIQRAAFSGLLHFLLWTVIGGLLYITLRAYDVSPRALTVTLGVWILLSAFGLYRAGAVFFDYAAPQVRIAGLPGKKEVRARHDFKWKPLTHQRAIQVILAVFALVTLALAGAGLGIVMYGHVGMFPLFGAAAGGIAGVLLAIRAKQLPF